MSSKIDELNIDNITTILIKSVLLRSLKLEDKEIKKITYKNKVKMYELMVNEGLILTDELDVKKAKEVILRERFN